MSLTMPLDPRAKKAIAIAATAAVGVTVVAGGLFAIDLYGGYHEPAWVVSVERVAVVVAAATWICGTILTAAACLLGGLSARMDAHVTDVKQALIDHINARHTELAALAADTSKLHQDDLAAAAETLRRERHDQFETLRAEIADMVRRYADQRSIDAVLADRRELADAADPEFPRPLPLKVNGANVAHFPRPATPH